MLGVDIGTTNVKAALYTYSGKEIFVKSATFSLHTDAHGAATQSAEEIKEKVFQVIKASTEQCTKENKEISFMSFSAAMHSLLLVNHEGEPISPVYTWGDRQSEQYINDFKNEKGTDLYHKTGTPIHPMSPLVKLYWLNKEHTEMTKFAFKFVGVKSFILYQLFGEYFTDYSIANATGLFNMHTLNWDEEALEMAGINEEQLPQLVPTTKVLSDMRSEMALALGLDPKIPIVIGASDGCLANLGVNAVAPGRTALTIGTSGAIRTVIDQPLTDKNERTFCYALTEDYWVVGGPVNNGGVVLDWAKERFFDQQNLIDLADPDDDSYDLMMEQIEAVSIGADDLFFFPYLMGERSPLWRPDAKGSFVGLDIHHRNEHMLRAVLEGINFNLYQVYTAISEVIGTDAKEILVTGGFVKSKTWLQMIADIFGVDFVVTTVSENACFGAGLLGLLALGEIEDFSELTDLIPVERRVEASQERHASYQSHFEKYQALNTHYVKMLDVLKNK